MFAHALGAADQISDEAFTTYGVSAPAVSSMREMFARWRQKLLNGAG